MLVYIYGVAVIVVTTVLLTVVTRRKVGKSATATTSHEADCEVLIVGSGVMGSALAAVLARDGRQVTVIERSLSTPDRIVGEVLHAGGVQALRALGLESCLQEIGAQFFNSADITDEVRGVKVDLPFGDAIWSAAFHHGNFVTALRREAQAEVNCKFIEGNVVEVIEEDGVVRGVRFNENGSEKNQEIRATLTFICDGAFSRLRKTNVSVAPVKLGVYVGMEYEGFLRDGPHIELFMTPDNGVHTYAIGPNVTRLLINVRGSMPQDIKQFFKQHCQSLPDEMRERVLASIEKGSFRSVPTYHLSEAASVRPGVLTMGDALNIRHPVNGAGMTVIFRDIAIIQELLKDIPDLNDVKSVQRAQKVFTSRRKSYTFVTNVFARCFCDIAFPPNDAWICIRSAAVDYMGLGGRAKSDLTALFLSTETRPSILFYHLTLMTFFMAYQCVKQERWWMMPRGVLRALSNTGHMAVMTVPLLWAEV